MAAVTSRLGQETGDGHGDTQLLAAVDEIKVEVILFTDDRMAEVEEKAQLE